MTCTSESQLAYRYIKITIGSTTLIIDLGGRYVYKMLPLFVVELRALFQTSGIDRVRKKIEEQFPRCTFLDTLPANDTEVLCSFPNETLASS